MNFIKTNLEKDVFVIAEIGNNHEGSFEKAQQMVTAAAQTGVDAVKFQTFKTELFINPKEEARFARLKKFELSQEQFASLAVQARKLGLKFISTPFDLESAKFLDEIVDAFKVASSDINFYPLLEKICETGKPLILSTGMSDLDQVRTSKKFIEDHWKEKKVDPGLVILHCVSSYPVSEAEANLKAIETLKHELCCWVGYSDHTLGVEAAFLSIALGAQVIEKHFTLDKNQSDFRDHKLSADPKEMAELVVQCKLAKKLLGSGEKVLQSSEISTSKEARRSIVAKKDLIEGHTIKFEDLIWLRPSGGLSPGQEGQIIGKVLVRNVRAGELLLLEMVR